MIHRDFPTKAKAQAYVSAHPFGSKARIRALVCGRFVVSFHF